MQSSMTNGLPYVFAACRPQVPQSWSCVVSCKLCEGMHRSTHENVDADVVICMMPL